jgi:Flp pilus assembly protein TadD
MKRVRAAGQSGRSAGSVLDRLQRWAKPTPDRTEVIFARQALDRQQLEEAERHLRQALEIDPGSGEVRTLLGVLHERLGEHRAACECYRLALVIDGHDPIARAGLRRYCDRFGLDFQNMIINPACEDLNEPPPPR